MRKLVAILFLTAHLFSVGGYQLFFEHAEGRADKRLIAALDKESFDESDLIEIKAPIELPYLQNWDDYERYDGEVIVEGVHYNYVKRKLVNDSMSFLCLPNAEKNRLYNARETFFALVNDIEKNDNQKQVPISPVKQIKLMGFDAVAPHDVVDIFMVDKKCESSFVDYTDQLLHPYIMGKKRPPATLA